MRQLTVTLLVAAVIVIVAVVVRVSIGTSVPDGPAAGPEDGVTFIGAGDIAECPTSGDEMTAELLDAAVAEDPATVVFTTGDNAYQEGSYQEFLDCYDPSWGRHKERTRPAVGNHEFGQRMAEGYHRYWGERGGPFDRYYYSFDVGSWHVAVVNSECHRVGCAPGSEDGDQAEWLIDDLEASDATCEIAIWHNPRWSSGRYGNDANYDALWRILHEHGVEMVLNGHEHLYERFHPLDPDGNVDQERGIRQFTVGTGGGNLRGFESVQPTSAVRGSEHGVLKLTLFDDRYEWEFVPVAGGSFSDRGSGSCHR